MKMSGKTMGRLAMVAVLAVVAGGCASSAVRVKLPDGARLVSDRDANLSGLQYTTETTTAGVKKVSLSLPAYNGLSSPVIQAKGNANAQLAGAYGSAFAQNLDIARQVAEQYFGLQTALGSQGVQLAQIRADVDMLKARLAVPVAAPVAPVAPSVVTTPSVLSINGLPVRWVNCSLERAKIVGPLEYVSYNANDTITWKYGDISSWPVGKNPAGCLGFFWFAVLRNGEWIGNKYDHIGLGPQTSKELKNIRVGYAKDASGQPVIPADGEDVAWGIASYNEDQVYGPAFVKFPAKGQ